MSDVASLEIRVGSDGVVTANERLHALSTTSGKTEKSTDSLSSAFTKMAAKVATVATVIEGFKKFIEVNREFDKLNAGLITATGSADEAKNAFGALEQFASTTPYSLRETTDAFNKLVNYGLSPSERALRSYGNTSSAMGKDIAQMVEAVADAQTGEFERLKEFGVKTKQEGDKVTFTFRGVSTTVGKTSKEIQDYLIKLGETNFGDAMANRMDTLDGKLSNLGDAWDKLVRQIGDSAVGDLIKSEVDTATKALDGLIAVMKSDFMSDFVAGLNSSFNDLAGGLDVMWGAATLDKQRIKNAQDTTQAIHDEIEAERIRSSVKRKSDEEEQKRNTGKDRTAKYDKSGEQLDAFNQMIAKANADYAANADKRRKAAKAAHDRELDDFIKLKESLASEDEKAARKFLDNQAKIEKMAKGNDRDELIGLNYQAYVDDMAKIAEARDKDLNDIRKSLRTQEQEAIESYARRRKLAIDSNAADKDLLVKKLDEEESIRWMKIEADRAREEIEKRKEARDKANQKEDLFSPYMTEEENIRKAERRKLEAYQEARAEDLLNEEEYQYLKAKLHRDTESQIKEADMRSKAEIAGNSAALFGNLAQVSKNLGGQQSAAYKGLFAMSKAFSIAQATMSIATGTAKALELGWPAGLAAGLQVAAQGAGLLATITSSNYAGAYDKGGYIPSGRIGLVGERGPELVQGPAMVTGREATAAIRSAGQGGGPQPINVRIINAPDPSAASQFLTSPDGERVLHNYVRRNATTIRQMLG